MAAPRKITEPHKELRFTRSRQALTFGIAGLLFILLAVFLWIKATPTIGNATGEPPLVNSYGWGFLPFLVAVWILWVAAHCARHAYIILNPLGIELFPFWFPSKNMNVIYWSEIAGAEVDEQWKRLKIDREGGGGMIVSLSPIALDQRELLERAIEGRMAGGAEPVESASSLTDEG